MGLVLPTYDPLAGVLVTTDAEIDAAITAAYNLPVSLEALVDGLWVDINESSISNMRHTLYAWSGVGQNVMPYTWYSGVVTYTDYRGFLLLLRLITTVRGKRITYLEEQRSIFLAQHAYTADVTQRDIYWKSLLGLGSNLDMDIPAVYTKAYAEMSAEFSHTDITIAGTDNTTVSVASGTQWRTALSDTPIFRDSYWEVDVTGNVGTIYVGLCNSMQLTDVRVGYGNNGGGAGLDVGFSVKVENEVVTRTVQNDSESVISVDCSTTHTVCFKYTGATLSVSPDGVTWTQTNINVFLSHGWYGDLYPAITLYSSTNAATLKFGNTNTTLSYYNSNTASTNEANNIAKGVYALSSDAPSWTGTFDALPRAGTYNTVKLDGNTNIVEATNTDYQPLDAQLTSLAALSPTGNSLKVVRLNAGETDFEFATIAGGGDMVLASAQTNSALKTFLAATFGLRNVANTFTSFFTNAATAARTWTLKDADGTLAFTSDITGTNSGTNTGDQTSIVGITGTKAQFDTAVSDGNILYVGDTATSATALATGRTISGTGDATFTTGAFDGSAAVSGAVTVSKINGTALSGLATGILKNTTGTGVPSIATDGTDYYSSLQAIPAANVPNGITTCRSALFTQSMTAGTYYYVPDSALTMPATSKTGGGMSTSTTMQWQFMMRKTAAGTAAFNIRIYRGTNGSTADTADVTQSIGTATAAVDIATVFITLKVTATGATGSYTWGIAVYHKAATGVGFGTTDATPFWEGTVSSVAMNTASLKFGIGLMGTTGTTALVLSGLSGEVNNMN